MAGPLQGLRVLDLGHDWACPHTARVLADFGAEVIKIEYPRRLDGMRGGSTKDRAYDRHPRFHQLHRNKKSLTLDLRAPDQKEAFERLVELADVLVDNSRTGVLDRLGLPWKRLAHLNPRLILVAMTAFGDTGPWASYAGYGATIEAVGGIQARTAYAPGEPPRRIREMDVTNGVMGACAVLTALVARSRSGRGCRVDLSEMEAASHALLGEHLLAVAALGRAEPPRGNRSVEAAPHGCYRCAGEDAWVFVSVRSSEEWLGLCGALGRPELAEDGRFLTAAARAEQAEALDALVEGWTVERTPQAAMEALQAAGVPAGAVLDAGGIARDPHLAARSWFVEAADGSGRFPGFPFRLSGGGGAVRHRGPDLGADNVPLYRDLLGRPPDQAPAVVEAELGTAFDVE